jgi:hypothetical protein
MANYRFDPINRIITVLAPDTEITLQELINVIRQWEADHLEWPQVAEASGKEAIGGNLYTAITVKLLNWKLKFEDRDVPTLCLVRGGNLLAVDEYGNYVNPIYPAKNVTVVIAQSTAAALIAEWTAEEKEDHIEITKKIYYLLQERYKLPVYVRSKV